MYNKNNQSNNNKIKWMSNKEGKKDKLINYSINIKDKSINSNRISKINWNKLNNNQKKKRTRIQKK